MVNKLTKIVLGAIVGVSTILYSGCESSKVSSQRDYENWRKSMYTNNPIQVPEHMKGTIMDPYPPAIRGYDDLKIIKRR